MHVILEKSLIRICHTYKHTVDSSFVTVRIGGFTLKYILFFCQQSVFSLVYLINFNSVDLMASPLERSCTIFVTKNNQTWRHSQEDFDKNYFIVKTSLLFAHGTITSLQYNLCCTGTCTTDTCNLRIVTTSIHDSTVLYKLRLILSKEKLSLFSFPNMDCPASF